METRFDMKKATPTIRKVFGALLNLEAAINAGELEKKLLDLVRMRASQINGCAYCLDMHSKELRAEGETEQRLYCLDAWRETPFYNSRERAALAWTEAVTNIREGHAPDEVFEEVRREFTEEEVALPSAAIGMINLWKRLSISLRRVPDDYRVPAHSAEGHESPALAR